jgi:hypothetical protein
MLAGRLLEFTSEHLEVFGSSARSNGAEGHVGNRFDWPESDLARLRVDDGQGHPVASLEAESAADLGWHRDLPFPGHNG